MMKKKLLSLLLVVVVAFGVMGITGCSSPEVLDEFTVFVPHALPDGYTSYNELQVYKELEKRTGMKAKFVHGEYKDIPAMWGSGYYDVMMLSEVQVGGSYPGGLSKGVEDGMLWDLTPFIEEKGKDYLNVVGNSYDRAKKFTLTDDGKRIGMYNIPLSDQGPWYGFVVREDWLRIYQEKTLQIEKGGALKELQTYDDWEAFLTFVKTFINKGKAPLFLYYTGVDMVGTLNAGFDVSSELYLKGGTTVAYGAIEPGYNEYLLKMKDWYAKGLIDADFAANNAGATSSMPQGEAMDSFNAATQSYEPAQYAAFPMIYTYISAYEKIMKAMTPIYQAAGLPQYSLLPVEAPTKKKEDEVHIRYMEKAASCVVVTNKVKSAEKVKAIVGWLNYMFTDEGMTLMNYGIENDTYTLKDGKPTFTEKITANPDGKNFSDSISTYVALNFIFGYDWQRELQVVTAKERKAMEETWNCDSSYVLPALSLTEKEGKASDQISMSAKMFKDEYTVKFIKGESVSSFATFVETMKSTYKTDKLIEVNASAYERYKNRKI